jgi:hypothetical protein
MPASQALLSRSALLLVLGSSTISAFAQEHLGPIDNVLLKNPYATPAGGSFGRGVVAGDFDDDGISDLAISEPGGTRLRILRGAAFTVGTPHVFTFFPETVTMPIHGYTMVSADFDGDGRDEIAVGAPNSSAGGASGAGLVYVMNLSPDGTWALQSTIQAGGAYPGASQANANFGNGLAAGDFNNDGYTDLAIGIRGQIVGGFDNAGAIMITYGGLSGITASQARIINRNSDGLSFSPKENDYFGWALAAGDFDGDADDDLAVGILNGTCPNGTDRAGAVVVLNGSASDGISNAGSRIWRPGVQGIAGTCAAGAGFGGALAAAHFSSTGFGASPYYDLAIGAPAVATSNDGSVHVIYGTSTGLDVANNQRIVAPATAGFTSGRSWFGNNLAAGKLARACAGLTCAGDSLAVGAPLAIINGVDKAGAVWIFDAGSNGRLDTSNARPIFPLAPLKIGGPHSNDQFGNGLASGDFNDDGRADLAIGVYLYDDAGETDAGAVQVLYQSDLLFVDGFDG